TERPPASMRSTAAHDDFVALSLPDMDEASSSQMLLMQQDQSSAYLDGRSEAINSIESTISELGSIFQQLAHMVSEQRDVVQRIDANVESIDTNIGAAHTELLKLGYCTIATAFNPPAHHAEPDLLAQDTRKFSEYSSRDNIHYEIPDRPAVNVDNVALAVCTVERVLTAVAIVEGCNIFCGTRQRRQRKVAR
ncbi:Syntaxin-5, partial [Coemansia sp. RSA 532]